MKIGELIEKIRNKEIVPFMTFEIRFDKSKTINWRGIKEFLNQFKKSYAYNEEEGTVDLSDCDEFFDYMKDGEFKHIETLDRRHCKKIANFLTELNKIQTIERIRMACDFFIEVK